MEAGSRSCLVNSKDAFWVCTKHDRWMRSQSQLISQVAVQRPLAVTIGCYNWLIKHIIGLTEDKSESLGPSPQWGPMSQERRKISYHCDWIVCSWCMKDKGASISRMKRTVQERELGRWRNRIGQEMAVFHVWYGLPHLNWLRAHD